MARPADPFPLPTPESIPHRMAAARFVIPDFRNLGVQWRLLLLAEGLRALWWVLEASPADATLQGWLTAGALFEPTLLSVAAALALLSPWLRRCPPGGRC